MDLKLEGGDTVRMSSNFFLKWLEGNDMPHSVYEDGTVCVFRDLGESFRRLLKAGYDIPECGVETFGDAHVYDLGRKSSGGGLRARGRILSWNTAFDDETKIGSKEILSERQDAEIYAEEIKRDLMELFF